MTTDKKRAMCVLPLALVGLMGADNAQEGTVQVEAGAQAIEIVTTEPGAFERLLDLPGHRGGFTEVLDAAEFEALLAKAIAAEGVSVASTTRVAVRVGARGEIANVVQIPVHEAVVDGTLVRSAGAKGAPFTVTVGSECSFHPRALSGQILDVTFDFAHAAHARPATEVPDGGVAPKLEVVNRKGHARVRLAKGQGVVFGGLLGSRQLANDTTEFTHVLYFVRTRILTGAELNSPF